MSPEAALRTVKYTGRSSPKSETRSLKAERNPKPEIRINPSTRKLRTLRMPFTIIGLGIVFLGLGFADEPSSQEATSARSEGHAKATTTSSPESGRTIQPPSGHERKRPLGNWQTGNLASERGSRPSGTMPGARSHPVPQAPGAFQSIASRNPQIQPIAPNATGLSQVGSAKLSGAVKNEPKSANQTHEPAASLVLRASSTLPVNRVQASGVGGPTSPTAKGGAVINGTGFKHRL
jgi:hypothetical protein